MKLLLKGCRKMAFFISSPHSTKAIFYVRQRTEGHIKKGDKHNERDKYYGLVVPILIYDRSI